MAFSTKAFLVGTKIIWMKASFHIVAEVKYAIFISVPGKMNKQTVRKTKEREIVLVGV